LAATFHAVDDVLCHVSVLAPATDARITGSRTKSSARSEKQNR
jgi:hypothetical protein